VQLLGCEVAGWLTGGAVAALFVGGVGGNVGGSGEPNTVDSGEANPFGSGPPSFDALTWGG
jgi:hypothetical protein